MTSPPLARYLTAVLRLRDAHADVSFAPHLEVKPLKAPRVQPPRRLTLSRRMRRLIRDEGIRHVDQLIARLPDYKAHCIRAEIARLCRLGLLLREGEGRFRLSRATDCR